MAFFIEYILDDKRKLLIIKYPNRSYNCCKFANQDQNCAFTS